MQATQAPPFSNFFPPELNQSILSYLPAAELEKHTECSDVKDINVELFLQKPAKMMLDQSWNLMLNNLLATLQPLTAAVGGFSNSKVSVKSLYFDIGYKNISLLRTGIFCFAKKQHNPNIEERNKDLLSKVIFHFFILASKEQQAEVLEEILSNLWWHKDEGLLLLEYLLNADVVFYKQKNKYSSDEKSDRCYRYREEDWYRLLCLAIRIEVPADMLIKLIYKGKNEGFFKIKEQHVTFEGQLKSGFGWLGAPSGRQQPKQGNFYVTPLVLAFLSNSRDDIISILMKNFPDEVIPTLDMLRQIEIGKSEVLIQMRNFLYHLTGVVSVGVALATKGIVMLPPTMAYAMGPRREESKAMNVYEGWRVNPEEAAVAKIRMLNLLDGFDHKKDITLSPAEKKLLFNEVKKNLESVKTPDECIDLYNKYKDAYYINNHYWSKTDAVVSFLWSSASTYTTTKKAFISQIRRKLYDMVMQPDYCFAFNKPSLYLEACRNIFSQPVFSEEHDKQGVDVLYKNKFKERLEKLTEISVTNLRLK